MMSMDITKTQEGAKVLYVLQGPLDTSTAQVLEDAVKPGMSESAPPDLVLDMENVPYVSSAGLRVILTLHKKAEKLGAKLELRNPGKMAMELFSMTNFVQFLNITRK